MNAHIEIPREGIADFCRRWQVVEFALLGSVLREDFRPDSDIDVLVAFDAEIHWGFTQLAQMRQELERLWDRKVVGPQRGLGGKALGRAERELHPPRAHTRAREARLCGVTTLTCSIC